MGYNEDFRALASIVINENIDKKLKEKAQITMGKIIDLMDSSVDIEKKQADDFKAKLGGIEVIKQ